MKPLLIFTFLFSLMSASMGQIPQLQDPLLNFKGFSECSILINATRINTNHAVFETKTGTYQFDKGKYLPSLDVSVNFGWIWVDQRSKSISSLKTGFNTLTRNADLINPVGTSLRFTNEDIQIPVEYGFRTPLKYNTIKNNLYRAVEIGAGVYIAASCYEKLDNKNNLDANGKYIFGNVLRFGLIGEFAWSALDNKGHGHRYGIRGSTDFEHLVKIKQTKSQLYPYYSSIGIFYNIGNNYQ